AGWTPASPGERPACRACPGSRLCRMGLADTRELSRQLQTVLGPKGQSLNWAISGCPNSCAQPQLAEAGIAAVRLVAGEDGVREPRFTLYRREGGGLGLPVAEDLDPSQLLATVAALG
ncbi:MAG TPA: hypothetical protein VJ955_07170, partial [Desulfuromonadales bacterium]|nr:hypothetical protein [Desulfuromonadales bacterium]